MKRRGMAAFLTMAMMMNVLLPWRSTNIALSENQNEEAAVEAEKSSEEVESETEEKFTEPLTETREETASEPEDNTDFTESDAVFVFQINIVDDVEEYESPVVNEPETGDSESGEEQEEISDLASFDENMMDGNQIVETSEENGEADSEEEISIGNTKEESFVAGQPEEEQEADVEEDASCEKTEEDCLAEVLLDEESEGNFIEEQADEGLATDTEGESYIDKAEEDCSAKGLADEKPDYNPIDDDSDEITYKDGISGEQTAGHESELTAAFRDDYSLEENPQGTEFQITGLSLTSVETNDNYSTLSFSFTSGNDEYSCLVTGLGEIETAESTIEACERLAQTIVSCFLSGEVFTLPDQTAQEQFGLSLNLIDAEKNDMFGSDRNICWAASASDMLEYAG